MAFPDYEYVSLENINLRLMVQSDPYAFLLSHNKGLIIDEAQNLPNYFHIFRSLSMKINISDISLRAVVISPFWKTSVSPWLDVLPY